MGPLPTRQAVRKAIARLPEILEKTLQNHGEPGTLQPGAIGGYGIGYFDVHVYPIIRDLVVP